MKLVLFFALSCLALNCGEGKLVFGWPVLLILGAGCHRRLYLVGFHTGLLYKPALLSPHVLQLRSDLNCCLWLACDDVLSFLLSACCESRKWVRVSSHLESHVCQWWRNLPLYAHTHIHTARGLLLKCQDPDNMMIRVPTLRKKKGSIAPTWSLATLGFSWRVKVAEV